VNREKEGKTMKRRSLMQDLTGTIALAACLGGVVAAASAAPMKVEALLNPEQQIRLDFADASKHFVMMVKRGGKASGSGPLAGTAVTEYGRHDIVRGVNGNAGGYLVFTQPNGDIAYIRWELSAVFVTGSNGKPKLINNGLWEVVGGTGEFEGLQGAGKLQIKFPSKTERNYVLEGELVGGKAAKQ
jgi:hypothetical protein